MMDSQDTDEVPSWIRFEKQRDRDRRTLRQRLITELIPFFQGDNIEGLLTYAERLEAFIDG